MSPMSFSHLIDRVIKLSACVCFVLCLWLLAYIYECVSIPVSVTAHMYACHWPTAVVWHVFGRLGFGLEHGVTPRSQSSNKMHDRSKWEPDTSDDQPSVRSNSSCTSVFTYFYIFAPLELISWVVRIAFPRESHQRQSRITRATVHAGGFFFFFNVSSIHPTLT